MKLYYINQLPYFEQHLNMLKALPVTSYDKATLIEKDNFIELAVHASINTLDLHDLLDYHIFPKHIMKAATQWQMEQRSMQAGDTIVQQVHIPPILYGGLKLIFGVRIHEIFDEPNRKGFSYQTLEGHVEKGISTFTVEQIQGKLIFRIHTFSAPGNKLLKILGPVFTLPYQSYCTHVALKSVKQYLENNA